MIKHIVMWKLLDWAEGKGKDENAILMKHKLEDLKSIIKGIREIEVGINIGNSSSCYDVVLITVFENQVAYESYLKHPAHIQVGDFISAIRKERICVDYQI